MTTHTHTHTHTHTYHADGGIQNILEARDGSLVKIEEKAHGDVADERSGRTDQHTRIHTCTFDDKAQAGCDDQFTEKVATIQQRAIDADAAFGTVAVLVLERGRRPRSFSVTRGSNNESVLTVSSAWKLDSIWYGRVFSDTVRMPTRGR